jgi:hypothetical protein
MSGHFLELHFCMFERSQGKHNNLNYHRFFWDFSHYFQSLYAQCSIQIKNVDHVLTPRIWLKFEKKKKIVKENHCFGEKNG